MIKDAVKIQNLKVNTLSSFRAFILTLAINYHRVTLRFTQCFYLNAFQAFFRLHKKGSFNKIQLPDFSQAG
ncbi:MAG: hypothetical protein K9I68_12280 [Bacteroidales bacterium]|nr:hypothetical protein [Bacteroidales bacterium]